MHSDFIVFYLRDPDGLSETVMQDVISSEYIKKSVYFESLPPEGFLVIFSASLSGSATAEDFHNFVLQKIKSETSWRDVKQGVSKGSLFVSSDVVGKLKERPSGLIINDAIFMAARQ